MMRNLRGMGYSEEESDDIIQSTWITFFDVVKRFEHKSKLKTFLFGVMFNKASEYKRKNFRLKDSVDIEEVINLNFDNKDHWNKKVASPDNFVYQKQVGKIIKDCLEILPAKQKIAFHMKEVEEYETEEICSVLEVTVTNLGVLLYRARNQMRECVESKASGLNHD
jgi:RNA polymerase sigma-70 factor (ECF subfamily)